MPSNHQDSVLFLAVNIETASKNNHPVTLLLFSNANNSVMYSTSRSTIRMQNASIADIPILLVSQLIIIIIIINRFV